MLRVTSSTEERIPLPWMLPLLHVAAASEAVSRSATLTAEIKKHQEQLFNIQKSTATCSTRLSRLEDETSEDGEEACAGEDAVGENSLTLAAEFGVCGPVRVTFLRKVRSAPA